jgi:hypothetical protein
MANWISLGVVQPSTTNWQDFPISVDGDLNLFQIKITEYKNILAGKAYLRTNYSNNLFSGKWIIFYPKFESEFFLINGLPSQINQLKTIQIKKSQCNPKYNYSVELKVFDEPINETNFNQVTGQLSSFDQSIQKLSNRIDSLPVKLSEINSQIEGINQNETQLLTILLGILP